MSIEALKAKARGHEQKEEWQKALDQYQKAIDQLEEEGQPDIGLYNRVGDLFVRVENLDLAVRNYEKAADLYVEAELHNNAIAVCKKIIRHVPDRHAAYLKIGQIRAGQGFLPDARTNFLIYSEKMQQEGDLDEAFRALVEFCDLSPGDVEVRVTVADQMASHERVDDAVEQYATAYRHLMQTGETDMAAAIEQKVRALKPDADLGGVAPAPAAAADDADTADVLGGFEMGAGLGGSEEEAAEVSVGDFDIQASSDEPDAEPEEEAGAELPMMDFGTEEGEEEEAAELPMMDLGGEDAEEEAVELPMMDFATEADEGAEEEEAAELPMMDFATEEEPASEAAEAVEGAMEEAVAETPEPEPAAPEPAAPEPAAPEPPAPEPAAPKPAAGSDGGGFVDLGSMILGGDEEKEEKSTRFVVDYQEPTGDEEADFASMLSQFKEKVSENLGADDVKAHYDLGTAYKEMGLLDEAVGEFQAALRASSEHLPTYELLGQTFIEMGKPDAAAKSLERALQIDYDVEDELIGIYYYLARAHEALGSGDKAVDYYDRVFALDINFADVTERLRALRPS